MTLILAVPSRGGIVFASDGQLTSGDVRAPVQKLYRLNDRCAWAGAGELALIQRVHEAIGGVSADHPLDQLRDQLANAIRQCVNILLQLDFRTPFFQGNPQALLALHPGDFVFVEHRDRPRILHITSYGTPEWIDRPFATGSGAMFAYALLQKYRAISLTLEQATLLAFKVIEEAIEVGAYGLGPPIEIWHVLPNSLEPLDEAKLAVVKDTTSQIRDREIQLLLGEPIGWNDEFTARAGEEESREAST